ncbi:two-component sensor histidine kinase [Jannaschia pagri]|uniref:histidine kinase n=1 Tax=Jannaschia pagri TaxID=2829797 RepID=A0ABQ4NRK1_9RHOB|nr:MULTISPECIES: HAMP domain-containing sensor histidine kinase [unclassified Jannaschia]GIT93218.1 two-component sensor histidine kinase [Jannaschia sp. AI_61]GIT97015.1 two-component sensor histidine kinase [Jannaschia sp. AI_62]
MFSTPLSALLRLSAIRQAVLLLGVFSLVSLAAWAATFLLVQREMIRAVDLRLVARMETALATLAAGEALPVPADEDETASFVRTNRPDGFDTRDATGSSDATRYLLRTTPQGRLELGEEIERQEELLDILEGGMTASLVATLLAASLAGLWTARRAQRRLDKIGTGLAAVAQGDLSRRIALDGADDLGLLALRIDATTARLEDAMTAMRVQSSNIAHDLRTPIARLRAGLEDALTAATDRGEAVDPAMLETALNQIDRITGTFDALLRLARIESGTGRDAFTPVDLGGLVQDVADTFGPVVEDANQTLATDAAQAGGVRGDRDLLVQLLANLIQNALRHGAERQTITIQAQGPRLMVTDEGPGIPFETRDAMLQPLRQGDGARRGEGYGLGLSLVRAIAELHGAELTLSDGPNGRGLRVAVTFPSLTDL